MEKRVMSYDNNNAGMHLVWHSHYGQYDDLKYYDELVRKQESQRKKKFENIQNSQNNIEGNDSGTAYIEVSNNMSKIDNQNRTQGFLPNINKTIDSIYKDACQQIDILYNALYIYAIKNHNNLQKKSAYVSKYLRDKSRDGSIDDMLFFSMISKMLDINIGMLAAVSEKVVKDIIYNVIIPALEDSYKSYKKKDDILWLENEFSIICFDSEENIQKYYANLRAAAENECMESLPDIYAHYKVKIYKNSENEYYLTLNIDGPSEYSDGNYLEYYDANVYHEKIGNVADFFEKYYKDDAGLKG